MWISLLSECRSSTTTSFSTETKWASIVNVPVASVQVRAQVGEARRIKTPKARVARMDFLPLVEVRPILPTKGDRQQYLP